MRFAVETWAPAYGAGLDNVAVEDVDPTANVERSIEVPEAQWGPRRSSGIGPDQIAFVDGVSRIDAQVWITEDGGDVRPGLCATFAAGAVLCDGRATVGDVRVQRGLFTGSGAAEPIGSGLISYEVRPAAGGLDELPIAVMDRMRALEADVARAVTGAELIVLDGLLWGRADIPNAIGYIKSHRTPYLPAELNDLVRALQPGERTPLFLVATTWTRFSWYLRLPGGGHGHPWAGVVRCEVSPDLQVRDAAAIADAASASLPRFASAPHKDPRAPQNLYPIAGLERELHRRSGDQHLIHRTLRALASRHSTETIPGIA